MPSSRWIASLNTRAAVTAHFAAPGCGLNTAALPAAAMLMTLQAIVGIEWVEGRHRPDHPERRVFLQRNPMIAAEPVRVQELDARHTRRPLSFSIL
jgi:hypothetical protein